MKRQPDGRFRANRSAIQVSNKILISRWVEREVIRLKRMGMTFETIADLLSRAGRGELVPTVSLPEDVSFPPDYTITKMGVCKAYRRRMEREPSLEAREHRLLDIARLEELLLSLQPGIKRGDYKAIEVAVRVLMQKGKIVGYETPSKIELLGNSGAPLPIALLREAIEMAEQEQDDKAPPRPHDQNNDSAKEQLKPSDGDGDDEG
jgi:hypothetical protein